MRPDSNFDVSDTVSETARRKTSRLSSRMDKRERGDSMVSDDIETGV